MRIFINVDDNRRIVSCYGYQSDAAICGAAGGTYDFLGLDVDYPQMKCKPDKRCFVSPQGLVGSPSACRKPYAYSGASHVGQINGQDRYMCTWCHPFVGDTSSYTDPTGSTIGNDDDWLEKEWLALANRADAERRKGTAHSDPTVTAMAMEWEYLVNVTIESGVAVDTTQQAYQEAQAAVAEVERIQLEVVAKNDEINNINLELDDLADELDAAQQAEAAGVPGASAQVTSAERAIANAQADLTQAQTELAQIQAELEDAEAAVAAMDNINGSGQSATEFIDPVNQVRHFLVTEYGIDEQLIDYMDAARGI